MADEEEEKEKEAPKSKLKDPKIMAVGALVVGLGAYQFVLKPAPEETEMVEEVAPPVEGAIHELDEMILNLNDEENTYLRVGVAIVLTELEDPAMFEADEAIAKDVVVEYLTSLEPMDFEPGEARQATKDTLTELMVEAYGEDRVIRVLFTGLVMQ
jgi:flagellar basal body-associated protein FliL